MTIQCDFFARFPELNTPTVSSLMPSLLEAWPAYCGFTYDANNKEMILNLIAHLAIVDTSTGTGASGAVQIRSVGSVSVSYATPANTSNLKVFFGSTKYGQRYLLLKSFKGGGRFV